MGPYYDENKQVRLNELEKALNCSAEKVGLLRDEVVLDEWHKEFGKERPKLVLIATTGGAYRASFWTTVVLDELNRCLGQDFPRHIRLITGASGGMVGAAYFVSKLTEKGLPIDQETSQPLNVTKVLKDESGLDSLTPVIRQLVLGDLPGIFSRRTQLHDRGIALEQQWVTLKKTFPDLIEGERAGWRPSLILSPMVVESGRRLLISNLDLSRLAQTQPLDPILAEGQSGPNADPSRIYSRSAVEFFRIFPEARREFLLQTAVRMSATFPFASPAVNLPMDVPRRVVDAGYYDNYGVDLATSWIYANQDWICKNKISVALIQIRAYPSEQEILSIFGQTGEDPPRRFSPKWLMDRLVTSFQGLSSPLAGGLSAREWSMRFRNATQVRVLDDLLNRNRPKRLFETFVFENSTELAMNWFLCKRDIASMRDCIDAKFTSSSASDGPERTAPDASEATSDHPPSQDVSDHFRRSNITNKAELVKWWTRET